MHLSIYLTFSLLHDLTQEQGHPVVEDYPRTRAELNLRRHAE
jgi:hypothetical protein